MCFIKIKYRFPFFGILIYRGSNIGWIDKIITNIIVTETFLERHVMLRIFYEFVFKSKTLVVLYLFFLLINLLLYLLLL